MNEVLLYIGMIVMMAIILIFLVILFSSFIKPKSSMNYFNDLMSLIGSACTSPQSTTYLQFNSPNSVVIQVMDTDNCNNSVLYPAQQKGYFSSLYPYNPSTPLNSTLLCYAQTTSSASSQSGQFFSSMSNYQISFYPYCSYFGIISCSKLPLAAVYNTYSDKTTIEFMPTQSTFLSGLYTYSLQGSSNSLQSVNISFSNLNGAVCYSNNFNIQLNGNQFGINGEINFSKQCSSGISAINVTFNAQPGFKVNGSNPFNVTVNDIIFTPLSLFHSSLGYSSGTCGALWGMITSGEIVKGSLVCQPIDCNNQNYVLTDQDGNPLEAIQDEQYGFFEVESGPTGTLQIINPNPESLGLYPPS